MKKVYLLLLSVFLAFGCSTQFGHDDCEYGSLTVKTSEYESDSVRALDPSTITSASVSVSGYGFSDIQGTVSLSDGAASGTGTASVNKIPAGDNRVVTVSSNVSGAVIRALCDISSGNNEVIVNWNTTAIANIFYYLIKNENYDDHNVNKVVFFLFFVATKRNNYNFLFVLILM